MCSVDVTNFVQQYGTTVPVLYMSIACFVHYNNVA